MVVMTVPFWYDVASLSVECTAVVCRFVCIVCIIIGKIPLFGGRFGRENGKLLHKKSQECLQYMVLYITFVVAGVGGGRAVCFFYILIDVFLLLI